jgi:hypothetical protein
MNIQWPITYGESSSDVRETREFNYPDHTCNLPNSTAKSILWQGIAAIAIPGERLRIKWVTKRQSLVDPALGFADNEDGLTFPKPPLSHQAKKTRTKKEQSCGDRGRLICSFGLISIDKKSSPQTLYPRDFYQSILVDNNQGSN